MNCSALRGGAAVLKDITLGQYFPGDTVIHRLDPRTKILVLIVYITALFFAETPVTYALMALCLAAAIWISRIKLSVMVRGLKPLVLVIVLTSILNILYTKGEPLFSFWIITVTREGVMNAVKISVRIIMLVMGTFMLTYTTSPIMLTYGLELLMGPLKKLKVPVHELAMMMSMALRLIPTLIEETDKIISAQKARGAEFDTGNLFEKARAMLPILVPLFISAFRRADELATAMEARCYHGGENRTRLNVLKLRLRDGMALGLSAAVLGGVIVLVNMGI